MDEIIKSLIGTAPMTAIFIYISRQLYLDSKAEREAARVERLAFLERLDAVEGRMSDMVNALENYLTIDRREKRKYGVIDLDLEGKGL